MSAGVDLDVERTEELLQKGRKVEYDGTSATTEYSCRGVYLRIAASQLWSAPESTATTRAREGTYGRIFSSKYSTSSSGPPVPLLKPLLLDVEGEPVSRLRNGRRASASGGRPGRRILVHAGEDTSSLTDIGARKGVGGLETTRLRVP